MPELYLNIDVLSVGHIATNCSELLIKKPQKMFIQGISFGNVFSRVVCSGFNRQYQGEWSGKMLQLISFFFICLQIMGDIIMSENSSWMFGSWLHKNVWYIKMTNFTEIRRRDSRHYLCPSHSVRQKLSRVQYMLRYFSVKKTVWTKETET